MAFLGLSKQAAKQLEFEVVPHRARLQLTRLLRQVTNSDNSNAHIARMNNVINVGRNVLGLPISMIEMDDMGDYHFVDTGWIRAELELLLRRPKTVDLVETLADLIGDGWLDAESVTDILHEHGCGISFRQNFPDEDVRVGVSTVEEIEAEEEDAEIPNIRLLVKRMDRAIEDNDNPGVLHASACIFETLAKDVIANANIENQTLASFFDRYRKDSGLPEPVLDHILAVYKRRNTEPLAGHGQTQPPAITREEAVVLCEVTKAFVRIERQLANEDIALVAKTPPAAGSVAAAPQAPAPPPAAPPAVSASRAMPAGSPAPHKPAATVKKVAK